MGTGYNIGLMTTGKGQVAQRAKGLARGKSTRSRRGCSAVRRWRRTHPPGTGCFSSSFVSIFAPTSIRSVKVTARRRILVVALPIRG